MDFAKESFYHEGRRFDLRFHINGKRRKAEKETEKGGNIMDFEASLKRLISKKGVSYAIQTLSSSTLSEEVKVALDKYFINGRPNEKLISSLA